MSRSGLRIRPGLALLAGLAFHGGCGYIGPPLPPALNLPNRVTDLTAVQRGSRIAIHFTMSKMTTEALPISNTPEIDLRVGASGPRFNERDWLLHARRVPAGAYRTEYEVPVEEYVGRDVVVAVRLLNDRDKDAGWSNFVPLAATAPLGRPEHVSARATEGGVVLTWTAGPGSSAKLYRVYRKEASGTFTPLGEGAGNSYLDTAAEFGKPYAYFVQGFEKPGAAASRSEASDTITFTPRDTFPPAVPVHLKAIAGTKTVELSWDRNTESDLAGYRLFRAAGQGAFEILSEKTSGASYSDRSVKPGNYRYSVSAIDVNGNESARSPAIEVAVP